MSGKASTLARRSTRHRDASYKNAEKACQKTRRLQIRLGGSEQPSGQSDKEPADRKRWNRPAPAHNAGDKISLGRNHLQNVPARFLALAGMSINYFDAADQEWHQDWVGADGTILHLRGKLTGNAMVMTSETKTPKGRVLNRITWTPLDGGKVKQEWSTSSANGQTWETIFVGIYPK